jgi:hypothetical protein
VEGDGAVEVEEVGEDTFGDFDSRRDDQPELQAREDDL